MSESVAIRALATAVTANDIPTIHALIAAGVDLNAPDADGSSALALAANGKVSTDIVRLLIENGADPGVKARDGRTPLHIAAWHGAHATVRMLLEAGADPTIRDNADNTPPQLAAYQRGRVGAQGSESDYNAVIAIIAEHVDATLGGAVA